MGINRRISSAKSRFAKHPEKVRAYLAGYSKETPAIVGAEIYDAIMNTPSLHDLKNRIKLNDGETVEKLVLPPVKPKLNAVVPIANVNKLREAYSAWQTNDQADPQRAGSVAEAVGEFLKEIKT